MLLTCPNCRSGSSNLAPQSSLAPLPSRPIGNPISAGSISFKRGCTSPRWCSYGGRTDGATFIGISAAGLWDYANAFATTFLFSGLQQLSAWVHSGHLQRPDLLIALPAWFANLAVVVGCLWGYVRLKTKALSDAGRLVLTFALTTGFLALDMAVCQPRYLGIFPRLLHPHLP